MEPSTFFLYSVLDSGSRLVNLVRRKKEVEETTVNKWNFKILAIQSSRLREGFLLSGNPFISESLIKVNLCEDPRV